MAKARGRLSLSSGIVPVYQGEQTVYLLLRFYRYWDFPKGLVEAGEHPLEAAKRELEEETAIHQVSLPWGEGYFETQPYAYGKVARYYLGQVDSLQVSLPINPLLGLPEHHEFRWMNYEQARRVLVPRVQAVLDWAHSKVNPESYEPNRF